MALSGILLELKQYSKLLHSLIPITLYPKITKISVQNRIIFCKQCRMNKTQKAVKTFYMTMKLEFWFRFFLLQIKIQM